MSQPSTRLLGSVQSLSRYPVKSLTGEPLERARIDRRGLVGDRLWSLCDPDGKLGSGKSNRRFRRMEGLLLLGAAYAARAGDPDDVPVITLTDGRELRGDDPAIHDALSAYVGRPVTLDREGAAPHHDDGPVHLVTTSTLARLRDHHGEVDPRRLRPNLVLATDESSAGFVEDDWVGHQLAVGPEVVLEVRAVMPRCVMVTMSQRGLPEDAELLHDVTAANGGNAGVVLDVLATGTVSVGDEVRLDG